MYIRIREGLYILKILYVFSPERIFSREVGNAWKDDSTVSIVPLIKKLVEEGIRIWIFRYDYIRKDKELTSSYLIIML